MTKTRIAIHGAAGRMGKRLLALGAADPMIEIVAALESDSHVDLGKDSGILAGERQNGVPLASDWTGAIDAVIDFSVPHATAAIVTKCLSRGTPLVLATTGLTSETKDLVRKASESIPIVQSPSMSLTVNLTMRLVQTAAKVLKGLGAGADVEIIETHHRFKEDSPSGTALRFGELIAAEMGQTAFQHGREGQIGKRPSNEIGYHAVRAGDNPGEHTILFGLLGESLQLNVKATNRDCYATGALLASKFVVGKKPGIYNMFDVLGL